MNAEPGLADTIVLEIDTLLTAHATHFPKRGQTETAWLDALDHATDALFIRAIGFRLLGLADGERAAAFDESLERFITAVTGRRAGILAPVRLQEGCYGPA